MLENLLSLPTSEISQLIAPAIGRTSLRETAIWCNSRLAEDKSVVALRSEELSGHHSSGDGNPILKVNDLDGRQNHSIVDQIVQQRQQIVRRWPQYADDNFMPDVVTGRLILYLPFYSSGDGLSAGDSNGFFDLEDAPPWDTFILFVSASGVHADVKGGGVVCWVPPMFQGDAADGIKCNPFGSLRYL